MAGRILTSVAVTTWVVASLAVALAVAASEGTLVVASLAAVASWAVAASLAATSLAIAAS